MNKYWYKKLLVFIAQFKEITFELQDLNIEWATIQLSQHQMTIISTNQFWESENRNLKRTSNELALKWGFHDLQFNDKTAI